MHTDFSTGNFFLKIFTNSDVPLADGFLTSLSILATFYTAKKIIQNWLIWIIADVLYTVLFFYKELYITALLYLILVVLAIYGLIQWKKQIQAF
jgi:nicotinamide mononucleotide transporter